MPFVVKDVAGGGPEQHALILAAFGIGGAVGAPVIASLRMPRRYLTVMNLLSCRGSPGAADGVLLIREHAPERRLGVGLGRHRPVALDRHRSGVVLRAVADRESGVEREPPGCIGRDAPHDVVRTVVERESRPR